jgi:L-2-hydroxyglutarate oxidase LhgO
MSRAGQKQNGRMRVETVDCVVVGAGVIGLAVARALALSGREVIVLEAAEAIGTETSSRNSEVIHAGIYYPAGSLMARTCVAGKKALYNYCRERGVAFSNCGKLIVATSAEESTRLAAIKARAEVNGVLDMRFLSGAEARSLEPNLACESALLSPSTGIIDSHGFMLALQGDAENAGAVIVFLSPVLGGRVVNGNVELDVGGVEAMSLRCQLVVNAAGLHAPSLARRIVGMPVQHVPTPFYAKGNYFTLSGRSPFSRLIYPVPVPGGLGVHLTIDLGGQARFGPDVEWIDRIDYNVDPHRAEQFYAAVRRYWPGLREGALQPGYAGIRPKIVSPGTAAQDFVVQGRETHGITGLINLFGIESPGLTAALALADEVIARLS